MAARSARVPCDAVSDAALPGSTARGVTVTGVMSANGPGHTPKAFAAACRQWGLKHYRARPYRPRTNGKTERSIRMLCNEWASAVPYVTSAHRRRALPA